MQENNYELKTRVNTCIATTLGATTLGATTLGATTLGATTLGATTLGENDTLISETEPLQDLNLRDTIHQCMAEETKRFDNIFGLLNDHIIHLQEVIDRKTSLVEELVAE